MAAIPTQVQQPLRITVAAFQSFATPAITVPFPSAYPRQTQIAFAYTSTATFAATRIPTTIGGVEATNGLSTALYAAGTGGTFGQSGVGEHRASSWPTWATAVIAACGGVILILLGIGIYFLCTRKRRRQRKEARRNAARFNEKAGLATGKKLGRKNRQEKGFSTPPLGYPPVPAPPPAMTPPRRLQTDLYPVPLVDGYGTPRTPEMRDSLDYPSGYVDGNDSLSSPARLLPQSRDTTPRSSLSGHQPSRRYYQEEAPPPLPIQGLALAGATGHWNNEPDSPSRYPSGSDSRTSFSRDRVVSGGSIPPTEDDGLLGHPISNRNSRQVRSKTSGTSLRSQYAVPPPRPPRDVRRTSSEFRRDSEDYPRGSREYGRGSGEYRRENRASRTSERAFMNSDLHRLQDSPTRGDRVQVYGAQRGHNVSASQASEYYDAAER